MCDTEYNYTFLVPVDINVDVYKTPDDVNELIMGIEFNEPFYCRIHDIGSVTVVEDSWLRVNGWLKVHLKSESSDVEDEMEYLAQELRYMDTSNKDCYAMIDHVYINDIELIDVEEYRW